MVTTYTMIAYTGRRSEESQKVMDMIAGREWGLLLLDEVHVVPANMFRKVRPSPSQILANAPKQLVYTCTATPRVQQIHIQIRIQISSWRWKRESCRNNPDSQERPGKCFLHLQTWMTTRTCRSKFSQGTLL